MMGTAAWLTVGRGTFGSRGRGTPASEDDSRVREAVATATADAAEATRERGLASPATESFAVQEHPASGNAPTQAQEVAVDAFMAIYRGDGSIPDGVASIWGLGVEKELAERIEWFKSRLGACREAPEPMRVTNTRRARFSVNCEEGTLEVAVVVDEDGVVVGALTGARDIEAPVRVQRAAEAVLALMMNWDGERFAEVFSPEFEHDQLHAFLSSIERQTGGCSLGAPRVVSYNGAVFELECGPESGSLKLDVRDEDDRIETLRLMP